MPSRLVMVVTAAVLAAGVVASSPACAQSGKKPEAKGHEKAKAAKKAEAKSDKKAAKRGRAPSSLPETPPPPPKGG